MAIAFRSVGAPMLGAGWVQSLPAAPSVQSGDLVMCLLYMEHTAAATFTPPTTNGTWTNFINGQSLLTNALWLYGWWRIATGAQSAEPGWTATSGGNNFLGFMCAYSGVDTTTPFDTSAVFSAQPTASATWQPTGITTATNGAFVLSWSICTDDNSSGNSLGTANGFTLRTTPTTHMTTAGTDSAGGLADIEKATAGAQTCPTWSSGAADPWGAATLALRPDTGGGGGGTKALVAQSPRVRRVLMRR